MAFSSVRELFFLRSAEARAGATSDRQRATIALHLAAAERAAWFRPEAAAGGEESWSLLLLRESLEHLLRAYLVARPTATGPEAAEPAALEPARALQELAATEPALASVGPAVELLAAADPLYAARLTATEARACARAVGIATRWLRAHVEVRSPLNVRATRLGRLAALAVLASYFVYRAVTPANVALHKPVTVSSRWPGTPESVVLVDGATEGMTAPSKPGGDILLTNHEQYPWVTIDLERVYTIKRVRIYNRNDANFDDGLPYTLEFSEDGKNFTPAARRDKHFGASVFDPPWRIRVLDWPARYVRIRGTNYVALSEVEVYGR